MQTRLPGYMDDLCRVCDSRMIVSFAEGATVGRCSCCGEYQEI